MAFNVNVMTSFFKVIDLKSRLEINKLYTFFYEEPGENYIFEGECHDFWEVVFVIRGKLRVTAESDIYEIESGQAIVHPPMEFHALRTVVQDTAYCVISFGGTMPFSRLVASADPERVMRIHNLGREAFVFNQNSVHKSIAVQGVVQETEAMYVVKSVEMLLLEMYMSSVEEKNFPKRDKSYSIIINELREHINERLTLSELAVFCNMSESNIKKTFKKYSGVSVMHYFNVMKITHAKQLLSEGCTVSQTAEQLGFADSNYFSTVFKRIAGMSPLEYKKRRS